MGGGHGRGVADFSCIRSLWCWEVGWWWECYSILVLSQVVSMGFFQFVPWESYRCPHTIESMVVMRGVGVQLEIQRRYHSFFSALSLSSSSSTFIPASKIQNILIYEGLQSCRVRYLLILVCTDGEGLVIVFRVSRTLDKLNRLSLRCIFLECNA